MCPYLSVWDCCCCRYVLNCLVKETLQTELSYVQRLRKLIINFIKPMREQLPEAASFLFAKSGAWLSNASTMQSRSYDSQASFVVVVGIEVIYSVNSSYLCDLAIEIGSAALPAQYHTTSGAFRNDMTTSSRFLAIIVDYPAVPIAFPDSFQCIYLSADVASLVLEILEFCSQDSRNLAQVLRFFPRSLRVGSTVVMLNVPGDM